jgi:hypothetical protein
MNLSGHLIDCFEDVMFDFPIIVKERDVYMLPDFKHTHVPYSFYAIVTVQYVRILELAFMDDDLQKIRLSFTRSKDTSDSL